MIVTPAIDFPDAVIIRSVYCGIDVDVSKKKNINSCVPYVQCKLQVLKNVCNDQGVRSLILGQRIVTFFDKENVMSPPV